LDNKVFNIKTDLLLTDITKSTEEGSFFRS